MKPTLGMFIIGLVFGGGIGFAVAAATGVVFEPHDHNDPAQHGAGMDHTMADHAAMGHGNKAHAALHSTPLEVAVGLAPELSISVTADPMSGHNLHVMVDNFTFSPQNASRAHVTGEGHAHVYANGIKLGRLYGPWFHLEGLPKGEVDIKVTLTSNSHQPYAVNGVLVEATQKVNVE